jgi:hypothetical protein
MMMGRLLLAVLAYGLLTAGMAILASRVSARLQASASHWLWEHLYLPLLRAAALVAFVVMAYPTIFGLGDAPGFGVLLAAGDNRFSELLALMFVLTLLLPLLPRFGLPQLVLPVQGLAASALVFSWLADTAGRADISLWPGPKTVLLILGLSYAAHRLATLTAGQVEVMGRDILEVENLGDVSTEGLLLFFQVPAILAYSLTLGERL